MEKKLRYTGMGVIVLCVISVAGLSLSNVPTSIKQNSERSQLASVFSSFWSNVSGSPVDPAPMPKDPVVIFPDSSCTIVDYSYVGQWGVAGAGNSQFVNPVDTAVDSLGNVYVTDSLNHRVQKFDSTGQYITQWGGLGKGNGFFGRPAGIAVGPDGNIYVVDKGNVRIQKFTPDGAFLMKWGPVLGEGGQFSKDINDITVDSLGNVYVTDSGNNRVVKFTSNGVYLTKFGKQGTGNGKFRYPYGITASLNGNVYVTDNLNNRVQKFSFAGVYIGQWGTAGNGNSQFNLPYGISADNNGDVFVVDSINNRIQKFDSNGGFITKWGTMGIGNGEFKGMRGVSVSDNDIVYVADTGNNRIQYFAKDCGHIIVNKYVVPSPDATDFTFSTSFGPDFLLDHDNDATLLNTVNFQLNATGNFTITENANPKYSTFLTCADPSGGTTTSGAVASIDLSQGETVTCNYRNTCISVPCI